MFMNFLKIYLRDCKFSFVKRFKIVEQVEREAMRENLYVSSEICCKIIYIHEIIAEEFFFSKYFVHSLAVKKRHLC